MRAKLVNEAYSQEEYIPSSEVEFRLGDIEYDDIISLDGTKYTSLVDNKFNSFVNKDAESLPVDSGKNRIIRDVDDFISWKTEFLDKFGPDTILHRYWDNNIRKYIWDVFNSEIWDILDQTKSSFNSEENNIKLDKYISDNKKSKRF